MDVNTQFTTVELPSDLLLAVDTVIREGRARSREEFVQSAIRRELTELHRSAVDAEFRYMAEDAEYQQEARHILAEFAGADWESLHLDAQPETDNRKS